MQKRMRIEMTQRMMSTADTASPAESDSFTWLAIEMK